MAQLRWWMTACVLWIVTGSQVLAQEKLAGKEAVKKSGCCAKEKCCQAAATKEPQVMLSVAVFEVSSEALPLLQAVTKGREPWNTGRSGYQVLSTEDAGRCKRFLQVMCEVNLARRVAEPKLVTANTQAASFKADRQLPDRPESGITTPACTCGFSLCVEPVITSKETVQ